MDPSYYNTRSSFSIPQYIYVIHLRVEQFSNADQDGIEPSSHSSLELHTIAYPEPDLYVIYLTQLQFQVNPNHMDYTELMFELNIF